MLLGLTVLGMAAMFAVATKPSIPAFAVLLIAFAVPIVVVVLLVATSSGTDQLALISIPIIIGVIVSEVAALAGLCARYVTNRRDGGL